MMAWEVVFYILAVASATLGLLYAWKKTPLFTTLRTGIVYAMLYVRLFQAKWLERENDKRPRG